MKKSLMHLDIPLKGKYVIMLAPSFIVDFSYPEIIGALKKLGFDKVVEVTYGAKMINREYHKILKNTKDKLIISTTCPGIVETIKNNFPDYKKNLIKIDSPMTAMAKICKKTYPLHKIVFLSPCDFKKIEADICKQIDYVLDFRELQKLFIQNKIKLGSFNGKKYLFDKFYNDYTKIYPLAGGLSKTAQVKDVLQKDAHIDLDGISKVIKFLKKPDSKIKFLDCTFCIGGCIGGPKINSLAPIFIRKKRVLNYLKKAKQEDIPELKKGLIKKSKGIIFRKNIL
jgi:iron only hydrogenase large subunit-like protein